MGPAKVATLAKFVAEILRRSRRACRRRGQQLSCAVPAHVDLKRLRCDGGADSGDTCLSDAQIALVNAVHSPFVLPFPVANGLTTYPQWLYGNETTPDPQASTMARWVTGAAAPTSAVDAATSSQHWLYGANSVRFFVARDANFDPAHVRPEQFSRRGIEQVSELIDSTEPRPVRRSSPAAAS